MTTKKLPADLISPHIASVRAYVAGKPIEEVERELGVEAIKLASNENPLGPSPKAVEAMKRFLTESHRYPDAAGYYLRQKLCERYQVPIEQITLGAGSTELIQLIARVLLGAGDEGLTSEYSFVMFALSVKTAGATLIEVPLKELRFDLEALAARLTPRTRLVYIANPNNPTGTLVTATAIDRLLARLPETAVLLLDEAYCDYVDHPDYSHALDYVRQQRNVLLLRTFSKVYGLAGLRIGYGMGHPELIAALDKICSPFNVSRLAQVAALAALDDDEHVRRSRESNRRGLALFARELPRLGLTYVPSFANFIYLETGNDARQDFEALLKMGVIVRPLNFMGLPRALRVTVGTEDENHRFLEALKKLLATRQLA
ncbi:MAG: histidinol-phosphate transaminase [Terriglobia bacterium]